MKCFSLLLGSVALVLTLSGCARINGRVVELNALESRRVYRVTCPVGPDCELEMGRYKICPTGMYAWFACPTSENTPSDQRRTELVVCNRPMEQSAHAPKQVDIARCDEQGLNEVLGH